MVVDDRQKRYLYGGVQKLQYTYCCERRRVSVSAWQEDIFHNEKLFYSFVTILIHSLLNQAFVLKDVLICYAKEMHLQQYSYKAETE